MYVPDLGVRGEELLDQFRFLGNCPPTSVNVGLGEG